MAIQDEPKVVEGVGQNIPDTLPLIKELEEGNITPSQYVQRRTRIVGRGTFIENVILPLLAPPSRREPTDIPRETKPKKVPS